MTDITATYSPEDNKLRIYAGSRLDAETYARVKAAGFRWAPRQELFVAPSWSPQREDLCIELAGEIGPDGTTIAERAEAKAARLDALAEKRAQESSAFFAAASRIGERFAMGQPILVGHHSERRARKDQQRMHHAMGQSVKAAKAVDYWQYRAAGVEAHANMKANPRTRANRIKTLLAELRDMQRRINHAWLCLEIWEKVAEKKDAIDFFDHVEHWAGAHLKTGSVGIRWKDGESLYHKVSRKLIEPMEAVERCIEVWQRETQNPLNFRWIAHLLNRLDYERTEQGGVERFTGEITATVLQAFAREHGADSPKATKNATGWTVASPLPLPLHIGEGKEVTLTDGEWRDLMHSAGHVPVSKARTASAALPPLLNLDVHSIRGMRYSRVLSFHVEAINKAEYNKTHADYKSTCISVCGQFRFRTMMKGHTLIAVFLQDAKAHPVPESEAITTEGAQA